MTIALTRSMCQGSTYRLIAMTCSSVFALPPRLAAMTPCLITQNRSPVTATSRTTMTTVTHQGSSPR